MLTLKNVWLLDVETVVVSAFLQGGTTEMRAHVNSEAPPRDPLRVMTVLCCFSAVFVF